MPNILIADDEQEIVKLLRIYLETDDMIIIDVPDESIMIRADSGEPLPENMDEENSYC